MKYLLKFMFILSISLLIFGCNDTQKKDNTKDSGNTYVKTIGPEGGTVTDPKGASVVIPEGALTENTDISILTYQNSVSL